MLTLDLSISRILCLYAIFSLSAMAGMNLSFLTVVLLFFFILMKTSFKLPKALLELSDFKQYLSYGGALFSACLLSLIVAKFFPVIYANHAPEITIHGFLKIWYLLIPLVVASVFLSSSDLKLLFERVKKCWWITTILLSVVAVIQFYTGWPLAQAIPTNPGRFHAILFFGHHLSTASIIIFPTFVALAQAIGVYQRKKTIDTFAWITGWAGILILFLSYARAAWVSVPIGIVLIFFRYLKPKARIISISALALLLAIGSQTSLMKERIENSMGITDRLRLWEANIDYFKHNPLTGIGWLKTQEMSEFYFKQKDPEHYHDYFWGHAHSNIFEMLGGTGIIGLLAFLAWSFFTLRLAYRASMNDLESPEPELSDFAYGLWVALVLLHLNGLTNVTFWEGKVMHSQMFAVALLLVIRAMQSGQNTHRFDPTHSERF